jgi:DNA modification methylase
MIARILIGDVLERLRKLPDESIDSVVTDPPYELGFMGKAWDSSGIAYDVTMWSETLRVLKPGGHLLAFGGSRTYHRMACAIEDAGFEIRDQIMWLYGSGFPKSLDVSKAIDKQRKGNDRLREFANMIRKKRELLGISKSDADTAICGGTTMYSFFEGRPNKPLYFPNQEHYSKMKALLRIDDEWDGFVIETNEAARQFLGKHQAPAKSIYSQCKVELSQDVNITAPFTDAAKQWGGWGTALKPAHEPICVARKPIKGTVAANVQKYRTGAINIDACRLQGDGGEVRDGELSQDRRYTTTGSTNFALKPGPRGGAPEGRWPANVIHDGSEEVVSQFPDAPGQLCPSDDGQRTQQNVFGKFSANGYGWEPRGDKGSAARFFYCAKANREERNSGCYDADEKPLLWSAGTKNPGSFQSEGTNRAARNNHPTVKPIDLMRYLCRLVTPPGGTVLDGFMGSGTTGIAALLEAFNFIGIEINPAYAAIAEKCIREAAPLLNEVVCI